MTETQLVRVGGGYEATVNGRTYVVKPRLHPTDGQPNGWLVTTAGRQARGFTTIPDVQAWLDSDDA